MEKLIRPNSVLETNKKPTNILIIADVEQP